ncbi:SulP family inorganic anion transporter [Streptomyces murinus]|uniref:SulP family inorganic anion transporter n=1 Tax=Streptomyces murinus TaxID=33900 RepID=UPI003F47FD4E
MRASLPSWSDWKPAVRAPEADLLSGLIVALVAILLLALGFGISSGLGAAAGLRHRRDRRSRRGGVRRLPISGVGPDRRHDGRARADLPPAWIGRGAGRGAAGLPCAGGYLVLLGWAGLSSMPAPVIEGFTAGIAVVIALQQFPAALGVAHADTATKCGSRRPMRCANLFPTRLR